MKRSFDFQEYKLILDILYEEHKNYTSDWIQGVSGHYNLKTTQVRHVCSSDPRDIDGFIDEDFLNYIDEYKISLGALYAQILHRIKDETGFVIGGRIKNDDSILLKLHRKRFEDGGKFSLGKYLNDLLGFRLIDNNFQENIDYIPEHILHLKKKNKRIRHNYREIGNYKGYHIYFMGENNMYFPIELQIWDAKQEKINLESHETYKKEYTYWPIIYKHN